jgi:hypothetical protein
MTTAEIVPDRETASILGVAATPMEGMRTNFHCIHVLCMTTLYQECAKARMGERVAMLYPIATLPHHLALIPYSHLHTP